MSEEKLFNTNSAVKMVEKRCKLAQTSTKCWSIYNPEIFPENSMQPTKSHCTGITFTSDIAVGVFHNHNPSNLDSSDQQIHLCCDLKLNLDYESDSLDYPKFLCPSNNSL